MQNQTPGIRPLPQTESIGEVAQYVRELSDLFARTSRASQQNIEGLERMLSQANSSLANQSEQINSLTLQVNDLKERVQALEEGGTP